MSRKASPAAEEESAVKPRSKSAVAAALLASASLGFTIFFFQPIELFLGNPSEFPIGLRYMAAPMLLAAAVFTAAAFGVLIIVRLLSEKAFDVLLRLELGALLAFYVQNLFLNGKMSTLTENYASPAESSSFFAVNLALNILVFFVPLLLYSTLRGEKTRKLRGEGAVSYAAAAIFAVQLVGAASSYARADLGKVDYSFLDYLSYKQAAELSPEGNVVVFLYDRMDGGYTDDMLEKFPELYDELEGFTYYRNNISKYDATYPSVPSMLTGADIDAGKKTEILDRAWKGETLPSRLKEAGWESSLILDKPNTYVSLDDLREVCSNVGTVERSDVKINYFGKGGVVRVMTRFSLARLVPYYFKEFAMLGVDNEFAAEFAKYDDPDVSPAAVSAAADLKLYDFLACDGIKPSAARKKFVFIHINGMHNRFNEDVKALYPGTAKYETDFVSVGRGTMEIVLEYLRGMKKAGVYDSSAIIILGDHGRQNNYGKALTQPEITGLMIKPAGAADAPMKTDDDTPMSNEYFLRSVLGYAGVPVEEEGPTYESVIAGDVPSSRRIYINVGGRATPYEVVGDARDFDNWEARWDNDR